MYPISFVKDIPFERPISMRVAQQNIVLWKTSSKKIVSAPDRCPHRAAKLSLGRLIDTDQGIQLECPYHGWNFNKNGTCTRIPQLQPKATQPKACNLKTYPIVVQDGIVWVGVKTESKESIPSLSFKSKDCFITDYYLKANYSYELQIENLLDPAHIHYVHDGFQGNRQKASYIKMTEFGHNEKEMWARFQHVKDDSIPQIHIRFIKPSVVDVSIYHGQEVVRKNIIYVSPSDKDTCNVLFRDVAFKEYLTPNPILSRVLLTNDIVEDHYQLVNNSVVDAIMKQDIDILESQQKNIIGNYFNETFVMPAECDRLIIEYRKWCRNQK
jgi:phenylpropionate dioxygenase-like ring-hydroxylating dioxygenase large terminal subunit